MLALLDEARVVGLAFQLRARRLIHLKLQLLGARQDQAHADVLEDDRRFVELRFLSAYFLYLTDDAEDGQQCEPVGDHHVQEDGSDDRQEAPCVPFAHRVEDEIVERFDDGLHPVLQAGWDDLQPARGEVGEHDQEDDDDPGGEEGVRDIEEADAPEGLRLDLDGRLRSSEEEFGEQVFGYA